MPSRRVATVTALAVAVGALGMLSSFDRLPAPDSGTFFGAPTQSPQDEMRSAQQQLKRLRRTIGRLAADDTTGVMATQVLPIFDANQSQAATIEQLGRTLERLAATTGVQATQVPIMAAPSSVAPPAPAAVPAPAPAPAAVDAAAPVAAGEAEKGGKSISHVDTKVAGTPTQPPPAADSAESSCETVNMYHPCYTCVKLRVCSSCRLLICPT